MTTEGAGRMSNVGSRGGNPNCLSREAAEALMLEWKLEEWGWLRARILMMALKYGEFHGQQLEHVDLTQRNMIGALTGAMRKSGLLFSTGEHRASKAAASHGRRSYVYRLSERGEDLARRYKVPLVEIGSGGASVAPPQEVLF